MWGQERCIQGFGGENYGKDPLGRPRCRWEDSIRNKFQEIECNGVDGIDLAQDGARWRSVMNVVMNLSFP